MPCHADDWHSSLYANIVDFISGWRAEEDKATDEELASDLNDELAQTYPQKAW